MVEPSEGSLTSITRELAELHDSIKWDGGSLSFSQQKLDAIDLLYAIFPGLVVQIIPHIPIDRRAEYIFKGFMRYRKLTAEELLAQMNEYLATVGHSAIPEKNFRQMMAGKTPMDDTEYEAAAKALSLGSEDKEFLKTHLHECYRVIAARRKTSL